MTASPIRPLFAATMALALFTGVHATAQEVEADSGLRNFQAEYFTQFAPRTALDMLQRVPGFQLQGGNTDRGLGQGGANVLLNGQQITGKGGDAFAQIGRVNADNVVRIEILDGATLNISGLSGQVANVITENKGVSGTWEWRPQWREELQPYYFAFNATVSGETGNLAYSAEIKNDGWNGGHFGPERQYNSDGERLRILDEKAIYNGDVPGGSVNLTWTPKEGHTGHLNAEFTYFDFINAQRSSILPITDNSRTGLDRFTYSENEWNARIDGDYEFPFADGRLKLISYYRAERADSVARSQHFALNADVESHTEYHQIADEAELIGRTEYSWTPSEGRDWEIALEGAFNYLDIDATFFDILDDSQFPNESRVEELRSEATLTHTRKISPKWDLQASLGGEYSEISQGAQKRSFIRPKGFVSTTYKPEDNLSFRAKAERKVGQLNFFDFVDSVSLEDNINSTGNSNLVPSQSWNGELEMDRQFAGGHTFKARLYGELISDLVDRIPIGVDGDAVGNIDNAHRYGIDLSSTVKGDDFGFSGMELKTRLILQNSSVEDPLGQFDRRLNNDLKSNWSIDLRHDIPNTDFAWGIFSQWQSNAEVYRLSTVHRGRRNAPWSWVYVEHKDLMGLKARATFLNIWDAADRFERDIYDTRRDVGEIILQEDQSRDLGLFFRLTLSGTF